MTEGSINNNQCWTK